MSMALMMAMKDNENELLALLAAEAAAEDHGA